MIDLSNVAPLMAAWTGDPWGKLRPPVSVEAVEMSALLAQATYRMDVDAWVAKGWRDVTLQVDGDLTDGVERAHSKLEYSSLATAFRGRPSPSASSARSMRRCGAGRSSRG